MKTKQQKTANMCDLVKELKAAKHTDIAELLISTISDYHNSNDFGRLEQWEDVGNLISHYDIEYPEILKFASGKEMSFDDAYDAGETEKWFEEHYLDPIKKLCPDFGDILWDIWEGNCWK